MISVYAQRRARLAAQLGPQDVAIIPTAPVRQRNRDTDFLYRHDSYFYYLTGFTEPQACLVLKGDGQSTLFCQPKDLEREIWDGYRLGPEAAVATLGVDQAFSSNDIDTRLPRLLENTQCVWFPFATHTGLAAQVETWLAQVRNRVRMGVESPTRQGDLCALLEADCGSGRGDCIGPGVTGIVAALDAALGAMRGWRAEQAHIAPLQGRSNA